MFQFYIGLKINFPSSINGLAHDLPLNVDKQRCFIASVRPFSFNVSHSSNILYTASAWPIASGVASIGVIFHFLLSTPEIRFYMQIEKIGIVRSIW